VLGQRKPARPDHCLSAASAIPIKAAAESQLPLRWEAEARKMKLPNYSDPLPSKQPRRDGPLVASTVSFSGPTL